MAVSENSVDLLVIAFSPNEGHFLLKSLRADLVLVEKVRMVAVVSRLLHSQRDFWLECA